MKGTILKVYSTLSEKTGKVATALFIKGDNGQSYKTWIDSGYGNYKFWKDKMVVGNVLSGLKEAKKGVIDADVSPVLEGSVNEETVIPEEPIKTYSEEKRASRKTVETVKDLISKGDFNKLKEMAQR